ncbi:hypothetical protein NGA_2043500, partial [Nannochloropsis gaditana CCMP526]|uniref:uncharacterized protein n=1 Tax=Nannochloropsis gaditana (strain CCMP526) TaxID=1093141 RepID=UPI00029F75A5
MLPTLDPFARCKSVDKPDYIFLELPFPRGDEMPPSMLMQCDPPLLRLVPTRHQLPGPRQWHQLIRRAPHKHRREPGRTLLHALSHCLVPGEETAHQDRKFWQAYPLLLPFPLPFV